jgi:hypothetical protein
MGMNDFARLVYALVVLVRGPSQNPALFSNAPIHLGVEGIQVQTIVILVITSTI